MPDLDAMATAIAARFASGLVTPPAGYGNIRLATANVPNNMSLIPAVFVHPESGEFKTGNGTRIGTHTFRVQFVYSQTADLPRDVVALRKWATVLVDQLRGAVQLAGTVAVARVNAWQVGWYEYGGQRYSGVELTVGVTTSEPWSPTA